jgi:hypothetical protein
MATRFEESSYLQHLVSAKGEITARGTSDDKVPPAPTDGVLIDFELTDRSHRTTDAGRPLRRPAQGLLDHRLVRREGRGSSLWTRRTSSFRSS